MRWLALGLLLAGCQEAPKGTPPPPAQTAAPVVFSAPTPVVEVPPEKPPEKLLAQFSTRFAAGPKDTDRVANIELLAKKLSDLTLKSGETWSFNETVGPRTLEQGFRNAPSYFLGEIEQSVGGGTCQVSSTLYAAALHANVEVLERRPHSRVSGYIAPGLDATVNYPKPCWDAKKPDLSICYDLQLKNPYSFDLVFRFELGAELDKENKRSLTASVFGTGEVPKVTTKWVAYSTEPFDTRFRTVAYWHNDRKHLKQPGRPGLSGARMVTITYADGKVETKRVLSKYSPVPEVFEVGAEFEKPSEEQETSSDDQRSSEQ